MPAHDEFPAAFPPQALATLARRIRACRWFTVNTLNRDFVGTRGFSIVFRRDTIPRVAREFPFFVPFVERALHADTNAFYLNPLELSQGSRVDPHIDRSLLTYFAEIDPPVSVSVLYVEVPPAMKGGTLVLSRGKKKLGRVVPETGKLVRFDGDLLHGVERVDSPGLRLSLVCEQYRLRDDELSRIPEFVVESRAKYA